MKDKNSPKINIILILPKKPHAFVEEISIGLIQAKVLDALKETATHEGHQLGIYYTLSGRGKDDNPATYIHSKLLIIDDIFLSVGSANMTNRSMGLDTELNASWEETEETGKLTTSIRNIRISLLSEHTGLQGDKYHEKYQDMTGLESYLDMIVEQKVSRLRKHTSETIFGDKKSIEKLKFNVDLLDPEKPLIEDNVYERVSNSPDSIFAQGITLLNEKLSSGAKQVSHGNIFYVCRSIFQFLYSHWIPTTSFIGIVIIIFLLFYKYL